MTWQHRPCRVDHPLVANLPTIQDVTYRSPLLSFFSRFHTRGHVFPRVSSRVRTTCTLTSKPSPMWATYKLTLYDRHVWTTFMITPTIYLIFVQPSIFFFIIHRQRKDMIMIFVHPSILFSTSIDKEKAWPCSLHQTTYLSMVLISAEQPFTNVGVV